MANAPAAPSPSLTTPPTTLLRDAALFLDFDGTLVELAGRPDSVAVDSGLETLMGKLVDRLEGRVAILSGRPVDGILALFGDLSLVIVGSHGLETRHRDGSRTGPERPASLEPILAAMTDFAKRTPGLLVEEKPLGAALHYRAAPDRAEASHALARALAEETGLHLQTGKMMVEVRIGGSDKGTALRALMAAPPMTGYRPVFLGDDDTDEPALIAATALGGAGILVGAPRPTGALHRLASVSETRLWLEAACEMAA